MTGGGSIQIEGLTRPVHLASGRYHNCVIEAAGWIKCWGYNRYAQVGVPASAEADAQPVPIVVTVER